MDTDAEDKTSWTQDMIEETGVQRTDMTAPDRIFFICSIFIVGIMQGGEARHFNLNSRSVFPSADVSHQSNLVSFNVPTQMGL